ncbi:glycosyltransferase [Vibrio sp. D420a]|uniref:glycosyltransferase family 2 protein n=1 Tax=Vibrio sp. D420a TaxID=2836895 RepID=UPI002555E290|nr:glycosyltransferase family 2 protein [Vibrio sp. D420a]MDK9762807.1 glycosyltransferase [Vibrio sp. D420a]
MFSYSVVIPCYESSLRISDTINSVLSQEVAPKQIILVDDQSNDYDDLVSVTSKFKNDTEVIIFKKDEKTNAAHSRNIGGELVCADLTFFLDSDDVWSSDHVSNVIDIFSIEACDCVYGSFVVDLGTDAPIQKHSFINLAEFKGNGGDFLFKLKNDFRTSTLAIRTDVFNGINKFDNQAVKHQDWDFFLTLYTNGVKIGYNSSFDVTINSFGEHRMSRKNNLIGTRYFLNKWEGYIGVENVYALYNSCFFTAIICNNKEEFNFLKNQVPKTVLNKFLIFTYTISPIACSFSLEKLRLIKRQFRNKFF